MCTLVYNEAPEAERTGFLFFKKMQSEKKFNNFSVRKNSGRICWIDMDHVSVSTLGCLNRFNVSWQGWWKRLNVSTHPR